jgi:WD40 repeat protein
MARVGLSVVTMALVFGPLVAGEPPSPRTDAQGDPLPEAARFRVGSVRYRCGEGINHAAISRDGRILAAFWRGGITILDLSTGVPIRRIDGTTDSFFAVGQPIAVSPDGREVVATGYNSGIRAWDVSTGKLAWEYTPVANDQGRQILWSAIAVSPDGTEIHAGSNEAIHILESVTGKLKTRNPSNGRTRVAGGGLFLVAAGPPGQISVRDGNGKTRVSVAPEGGAMRFAVSPAQRLLATSSGKARIDVWDMATAKPRLQIHLKGYEDDRPFYVTAVAITPDERTLLAATAPGDIRRWDLATGKELSPLAGHMAGAYSLLLPSDGKTLISSGWDQQIRKWDLATGKLLAGPDGYLGWTHAAFLPTRDEIVLGDGNGRLELWDANTGRLRVELQKTGEAITAVMVSSDGRRLACGAANTSATVWDVTTGKRLHELTLPIPSEPSGKQFFRGLALSPDGRQLATATDNDGLRLWDLANGKPVWNQPLAGRAAFSPDGGALFWSSGAIYRRGAYDTKTGNSIWENESKSYAIGYSLAISPDGRVLALGYPTGQIILCDAVTGTEMRTWTPVRNGGVWALAFSPDGTRLLGSVESEIRLWDVASGAELLRLAGHTGPVHDLSFAPHGRTAVSASRDSTVVVWSLRAHGLTPPAGGSNQLWAELTARDPVAAYRAQWLLLDDPKSAVTLLREKVAEQAASDADLKKLDRLIANLGASDFKERESADADLRFIGSLAKPQLRRVIAGDASAEAKRRAAKILEQMDAEPSPYELRQRRTVEVVAMMASPTATALVREWAGDRRLGMLAEHARAAVRRLDRFDANR